MVDRVAVLGNCQSWVTTTYLEAIAPGVKFRSFSVNRTKTPEAQEEVARRLGRFDLIFCQYLTTPSLGPLRTPALIERYSNVVQYPQVVFPGFHPDVMNWRHDGKQVRSAVQGFNSLIVAAAFAGGIPEDRVPDLFNSYIFTRLGYFDEYPRSVKYFLSTATDMGYDMAADVEDWLAAGPFMYTSTHPAVRVTATIATKLAAKAGIACAPPEAPVPDLLAKGVILPVFPDLARRIGVEGGSSFRLSGIQGGDGSTISLGEFVRKTYAGYRTLPPEAFELPRIQAAVAVLREEVVL